MSLFDLRHFHDEAPVATPRSAARSGARCAGSEGMGRPSKETALDTAAARLRDLVLEADDGAFIGSEESLISRLGFSRSTVRQVARLLEREGLLRVRRGINGGYFGARPSVKTVEGAVATYLETLDMDAEDVTIVASVLWVEVLRKAAALRSEQARRLAETFRLRVRKLKPTASFDQILALEQESRAAIFDLTKCRYIELIFTINTAFAGRRFPERADQYDTQEHRVFVQAWTNAKLMELSAISEGDVELGEMAARHIRHIWHRRVWGSRSPSRKPGTHFPPSATDEA
jgi:GntR family transcriptional regulator, transcriptional repressor for pyruvate dehydrogenase complex